MEREPAPTTSVSSQDADDVVPSHLYERMVPMEILRADARTVPTSAGSVDLVVTSPPYWKKRDYGIVGQIGQESTIAGYVAALVECLTDWRRILRPTGSVFLNLGDSFHRKSLAGIPGRVEAAALDDGWIVRNRIVWAKDGGMPDPTKNRLAGRHEVILHLAVSHSYYYDLFGYTEALGGGGNPGDVWRIPLERNMGSHLAPFPEEIVRRAILLACPEKVCATCRQPSERIVRRTTKLDPARPQAKRAMQIAEAAGLTEAHYTAIQATGISDAGKATRTQTGTGQNSAEVKRLAAEAKAVLGGYFREFTFTLRETAGWTDCGHDAYRPAIVIDPFAGTGTTLRVAEAMGRRGLGIDLAAGVFDPMENVA